MKFCGLLVLTLTTWVLAGPPQIEPVPLNDYLYNGEWNNVVAERITNGQLAEEDQFPYQVGLSLQKSPTSSSWCGGSLIGQNWVLTAAHCTVGAISVIVYLGSTIRTSPKVSYSVDSTSIYQHSGYDSSILANDISLIKIPSVTYSSSIQSIRLPAISSSYSTYAGEYAVASGWGRTSDGNEVYFYFFPVLPNDS